MKHCATHRIAAGLVAALYLLGGAQHWLVVDPCPHHDAALFQAGLVDAGDAGHHAHGASTQSESSDPEDHGPCGCVGPCATPSPTALPSSATLTIAGVLERVESVPTPPREIAPQQFVPFLLPYAHAPPSLA
jgi:hypothetical protein